MFIIFNGPPGSGKDEACHHLVKKYGCTHKSFKQILFTLTCKLFKVDYDWFMSDYDNREKKEAFEEKLGMSRREAMIHTSENVIKPLFGKDYFGKALAEELLDNDAYCASDGGFLEEIDPVINKLGKSNVLIVNLFRDGCDFSKDSRKYLFTENVIDEFVINNKTDIKDSSYKELIETNSYHIHNNGSIEEFRLCLDSIYEKEQHVRNKRHEQ
jgi:DNA polymerase III delta prime subunit